MTYQLSDEQIDAVLDAPGNMGYVIADKRERLRLFARAISDLAIKADREARGRQEVACLGLLADIRAAVGDPEGRLMQPELLERLRGLAADGARLDWLDGLNAALNRRHGTTYRWRLVLSPNVVRLMVGPGGNGHVAAIDLHYSEARGVPSCRRAIDDARIAGGPAA